MGDIDVRFEMDVQERLVIAGVPDVIIAGPVLQGACRNGDRLRLVGGSTSREVTCLGIELLNWGASRGWVSLRVSDVDLEDVTEVTKAIGGA